MVWKPLGILMIFPTFIISVIIAWRTRAIMSELCHNLAICGEKIDIPILGYRRLTQKLGDCSHRHINGYNGP